MEGIPDTGGTAGRAADGAIERVREALRQVIDPELGINIVDLGLVYTVETRDGDVAVAVTMTTPACPLNEYIATHVEAAIRHAIDGVRAVQVDVVWEPPWRPDMMAEAAKRRLGWIT